MSTLALSASRFLAAELFATFAMLCRFAFLFAFRAAGRAYRLYCEYQEAIRAQRIECQRFAMHGTLEAVRRCWWRLKPAQRVRVLAWFRNVDLKTIAFNGAAIIAAEMQAIATPSERLAAHNLAKREATDKAKRQAILATRELLARIDGQHKTAIAKA